MALFKFVHRWIIPLIICLKEINHDLHLSLFWVAKTHLNFKNRINWLLLSFLNSFCLRDLCQVFMRPLPRIQEYCVLLMPRALVFYKPVHYNCFVLFFNFFFIEFVVIFLTVQICLYFLHRENFLFIFCISSYL